MRTSEERSAAHISPNINVTPLIDVLLVLLIIFMVVTPLKPSRFKAHVPQHPLTEPPEPNPLTLVVTVDRDLRLKLNKMDDMGSVNDMSKISSELARVFQERTERHTFKRELADRIDLPEANRIEKTVFIKAPRSIWYGDVVKVIDGVKVAGATPVGLQIDDLD